MQLKIIFIYCLCDEILRANHFQDDPQCKMSTAEVMTIALISALFFQGNYSLTLIFSQEHRYFSSTLSLSRFCKRVHRVPATTWMQVIFICRSFLSDPKSTEYIVDSFPVPVCQNCRIFRCKLFSSKTYRGYCASKKTYFFGIKVHMLVSKEGIPVEFLFTPGSEADITAFRNMELNLPENTFIYADKAYTDYMFEDFLKEFGLSVISSRRANAKRQHSGPITYLQKVGRKRIETTFSQITRLMPRSIHAVTAKGFYLKVVLFICAFSINICCSAA